MKDTNINEKCDMCGICCKLFFINLNEEEYKSGQYKTMFEKLGVIKNFSKAKKRGINLLAKKEDNSCIYLLNNLCKIHKTRPKACREFFCGSKNKKFKKMQEIINFAKLKT